MIPLVIVFQVQRLVTPIMLQRKRQRLAVKRKRAEKNRQAAAEYAKILAQRQKEAKEMRRKKSLPSVNPGILSRARTLLCLKIVVAFRATIKGKRKNF